MINQNYDYLKRRYLEYWNKENHDRPLLSIYAQKINISPIEIKHPQSNIDRWMDTEYILKTNRVNITNTYYGGEAFPILNPNLGPDILGAIAGCDIEFGKDTSWAVHNVKDWKTHEKLKFDTANKWWKKIKEITQAAISDSNGDYLVGITDLHPGTDGLVSLRGPQELCMDIYDYPEQITQRTNELFEIYKIVFNELNQIISTKQEGSTNWMGILHPEKKWYVTSSDFSCLISKENFEQFVIPGIRSELEVLDASIYHLDGPSALKHLDRLLEIPNLNGIQWVYGAGQPSARYWIDTLKKIQKAGKLIQINIEEDDLKPLCEALEPEGVHFSCYSSDEEQAKEMVKMVEDIYRNK